MINKRLLIKNLLAHNDENSFYDKKLQIDISEKEGKAKFLKHVCALSNSNPKNNSYIVIGIQDEDNKIIGVDFFDDSKIQNLINAYLENPPSVQYENISFPHLPDDKVVGLVTIRSSSRLTSLKRNIWKYYGGSVFFRDGSMSMPKVFDIQVEDKNSSIVAAIEAHAQNNIEYTLDGVFAFMDKRRVYDPKYLVFQEYFVMCWAGQKKTVNDKTFYSRVDIALINEQVRLFYSDLDEVSISYSKDWFKIVEFINLGFHNNSAYYKLEETIIRFQNNASYQIESQLLFDPPQIDLKVLHHIFNSNNLIIDKLARQQPLSDRENKDLLNLPISYLMCHFNGFEDALNRLKDARLLIRTHSKTMHQLYNESMRILRKVKYN